MEALTTVGFGAISVYLTKDAINKLLGPTAEYLGEGIRDITRRRIESIGKMFSNASKRLEGELEAPGRVPPRILRTVVNEASYCEDPLALEYFGGVLASSRTEDGRDDRGARLMNIVDTLSTYQIRSHYLLYSTIASLFAHSGKRLGTSKDRSQLEVFLPYQAYVDSMTFSLKESHNPQIMFHIWHGLSTDGLIESNWRFGSQEDLRKIFANAPEPGIVCSPSLAGAELFLWAFGYGALPLEHMFSGKIDTAVEDMTNVVPGALATKMKSG